MMELEQAIKILSRDTSLEAVNELKYYAGFCSDIVIEQIQEAMDMGAEALKKQIPKKPLYIYGDYDEPLCSDCKLPVFKDENEGYCSVCGQAIQWGE